MHAIGGASPGPYVAAAELTPAAAEAQGEGFAPARDFLLGNIGEGLGVSDGKRTTVRVLFVAAMPLASHAPWIKSLSHYERRETTVVEGRRHG
jgi:hypothetical protein